ncbi:MAG TPA: FKBP-type peptidyl-prolyl cis-trans isomerase [Ferruginibacter sp.]|nr:FKBP-type peptidylprolyl isomerase [Chitinophagaceae bacterium]HRI24525.1 FKBP-type peptidyl-prolyl cis-trans isomerase [Ferruginibacter sp.]
MNKRQFFLAGITALLFLTGGCKKSSDNTCGYSDAIVTIPPSEAAALQAYVSANRPAAIQHSSGLYYEMITTGTGASPASLCSNVTVRYSGYLTNGTKFDENLTGATFALGQLIVGWQKGLPLAKTGGTINLYIPPSLGYGANQVGSIPPNSILVFSIQLVAVQ